MCICNKKPKSSNNFSSELASYSNTVSSTSDSIIRLLRAMTSSPKVELLLALSVCKKRIK